MLGCEVTIRITPEGHGLTVFFLLTVRQWSDVDKSSCSNPSRAVSIKLLTPGLDNTRLFISLTAGAGTRCMSLLSSSPSLLSTAASFLGVNLLSREGNSQTGDRMLVMKVLTRDWKIILCSFSNMTP